MNDHDLLIELKVKVEALIEKVNTLTDDHEDRIRALEQWRWYTVGITVTIASIASFLANKYL